MIPYTELAALPQPRHGEWKECPECDGSGEAVYRDKQGSIIDIECPVCCGFGEMWKPSNEIS